MTASATTLLESVLVLPKRDRLKIAEALLDSLPEPDAEIVDELRRRAEEARSDPTAGIPWSEVKKTK